LWGTKAKINKKISNFRSKKVNLSLFKAKALLFGFLVLIFLGHRSSIKRNNIQLPMKEIDEAFANYE